MPFSPSQRRQFSERNIGFGEAGAAKRRKQLSDYAQMLEGLRQEGRMELAEAGFGYDRPEQEARISKSGAETEGLQLGNVGQKFFQRLTKEYAPSFMRQELGWPEPESRANVFFPERVAPLGPKFDLSSPRGGATGSWEPEIPSLLTSIGRKKKDRTASPFGINY